MDLDSTKGAQKLSFAQEALIGVGLDGVNENKSLSEIFEKMVFSVRILSCCDIIALFLCNTTATLSAQTSFIFYFLFFHTIFFRTGQRSPPTCAEFSAEEQGQHAVSDASHPFPFQ